MITGIKPRNRRIESREKSWLNENLGIQIFGSMIRGSITSASHRVQTFSTSFNLVVFNREGNLCKLGILGLFSGKGNLGISVFPRRSNKYFDYGRLFFILWIEEEEETEEKYVAPYITMEWNSLSCYIRYCNIIKRERESMKGDAILFSSPTAWLRASTNLQRHPKDTTLRYNVLKLTMRIQYPRIQLTETEYTRLVINYNPLNCEQKPKSTEKSWEFNS